MLNVFYSKFLQFTITLVLAGFSTLWIQGRFSTAAKEAVLGAVAILALAGAAVVAEFVRRWLRNSYSRHQGRRGVKRRG